MQTEPTVQFFDDEDDTLYIELEGKFEVLFSDTETTEFMGAVRGGTTEQIERGITALTLEMGFAFIHQIAPVLRKALLEQYDMTLKEESVVRIDEQVQEILPGFIKMLQDVADEEDG